MAAKNVLVVSYYFPPSGGPGVQRTLKFVKYLPQFGWTPTVLTVAPDSAAFPAVDETLLDEVPAGIRVERTKSFDPYGAYAALMGKNKGESVGVGFITESAESGWRQKAAKAIRANLFLPDARVGWVRFAKKRARRLASEHVFDAVITSGPPHSAHLIGADLRRRYGIPWLMDMRDPWTDVSYYDELPMTPLAKRRDAKMEQLMFDSADAIVTVTRGLEQLFKNKTRTDVTLVSNGYDPDDFVGMSESAGHGFIIAHVGNLAAVQNPTGLWEAVAKLVREKRIDDFEIRFVGNTDVSVRESIDRAGLSAMTNWIPYLPHGDAIREMTNASVLLVCINRVEGGGGIVPAKMYEYMASGKPILGVGDPEGDAAAILDDTGTGDLFHWDDAAGMTRYLGDIASSNCSRPRANREIQGFSRVEQTRLLATILDNITE